MKKIFRALLFSFCFPSLLFASEFLLGADASTFDFLFLDSFRSNVEFGYQWEDVRLSCALRYGSNGEEDFNVLEGALSLSVYPIEDLGLVVGLSIFRMSAFWGIGAIDLDPILSSETFIGWNFSFFEFFFEPRIFFSENMVESNDAEVLLESMVPQFSKAGISLLFGMRI